MGRKKRKNKGRNRRRNPEAAKKSLDRTSKFPTNGSASLMLTGLGVLVAIVAVGITCSNDRTQNAISQAQTLVEADAMLDEAGDLVADGRIASAVTKLTEDDKKLELAERLLEKALILAPTYTRVHVGYSKWHRAKKQYPQALAAANEALGLDGTYAKAHLSKGNSLFLLNRFQEALASYELALEHDPTLAPAAFNVALVYAKLDDLDRAQRALAEAISLHPNYPEIQSVQSMVRAIIFEPPSCQGIQTTLPPGVTDITGRSWTFSVSASDTIVVCIVEAEDQVFGHTTPRGNDAYVTVVLVSGDEPDETVFSGRIFGPTPFDSVYPHETGHTEN